MIDWRGVNDEFWFEWLIEEEWMMNFDLNDWLRRCGWWILIWMIDWGGVQSMNFYFNDWLGSVDEWILIWMIDRGDVDDGFWFKWLIGEVWTMDLDLNDWLGRRTNAFWFQWLIGECGRMNFDWMNFDFNDWLGSTNDGFWFEWLIWECGLINFDLNDWLRRCGWWILF